MAAGTVCRTNYAAYANTNSLVYWHVSMYVIWPVVCFVLQLSSEIYVVLICLRVTGDSGKMLISL